MSGSGGVMAVVSRLLVALAAMVAAAAYFLAIPASSPARVAEAAVEAEVPERAASILTVLLLGESLGFDALPNGAPQVVVEVIAEALDRDWLARVLTQVAGSAEVWVAGEGTPPLVMDLTELKTAAIEHPEGYVILTPLLADPDPEPGSLPHIARRAWVEADGPPLGAGLGPEQLGDAAATPEGQAAVEAALEALPSEVSWDADSPWWERLVDTLAGLRRNADRAGVVALGVLAVAAVVGVLSSRLPFLAALLSVAATAAIWAGLVLAGAWMAMALLGTLPPPAGTVGDTLAALWGWTRPAILIGGGLGTWLLSRPLRPKPVPATASSQMPSEQSPPDTAT